MERAESSPRGGGDGTGRNFFRRRQTGPAPLPPAQEPLQSREGHAEARRQQRPETWLSGDPLFVPEAEETIENEKENPEHEEE